MSAAPTANILSRALAILERETPAAAMRLWREIDGLSLTFEINDEVFTVVGSACGAQILAGADSACAIHVRSGNETILQLIDGNVLFMDCVLAGALDIRGDVRLMPAISRASVAFAEGAVRARAMRALLQEFRAKAGA